MIDNDKRWTQHYRNSFKIPRYPEGFVKRLLCSTLPVPALDTHNYKGKKILDLSCGYGRNIELLRNLNFQVYATEISEELVRQLRRHHPDIDIRQGKAHNLPFKDKFFKGIVACNSCYYLAPKVSFTENLAEIHRVLKPSGWFLGSLVASTHSVMDNALLLEDGSSLIQDDILNLRNNYRLQSARSKSDVCNILSPYFNRCKVGHMRDSFEGFNRDLFYFTCYSNE